MLKKWLMTRNVRRQPGLAVGQVARRRARGRARAAAPRARTGRMSSRMPRRGVERERRRALGSPRAARRPPGGTPRPPGRARRRAPRPCAASSSPGCSVGGSSRTDVETFWRSDAIARKTRLAPCTSWARSSSLRPSVVFSRWSELMRRRSSARRLTTSVCTAARSRYVGSKRRSTSSRSSPRPAQAAARAVEQQPDVVARVGVELRRGSRRG